MDLVVQSLHKTGGSFSQTSLLHLNKTSSIEPEALETALWLTSTTSPCLILLASIEETISTHSRDN